MSAPTETGRRDRSARRPDSGRHSFFEHPLTDYFLLLGITLALVAIGLVMVYSASSVESLAKGGSTFSQFQKQAMFAAIGLPIMFWLSRRPVEFFSRIASTALLVSAVLLVAVLIPGIGVNVGGQQNWIALPGGMSLQPSEIAKLSLILWCARLLSRRADRLDDWRSLLLPLVPVCLAIIVLVLLEGDVGTALVFMPVIAMMIFMAGVPLRYFVLAGSAALALIAFMSVTEGYRMQRFTTWLNPDADPTGAGWQTIHGKMALATGGWWGVGLGASREKWGALPEAHNDFIFAVIGEELGLVGTILVLSLIVGLGLVTLRIARRSTSLFVRLVTLGIFAWVITQAVINMGAVIGLMPVTGVPLPLVSYGGSSLILVLAAVGILLAFARREPAAAALIRQRRISERRSLRATRSAPSSTSVEG